MKGYAEQEIFSHEEMLLLEKAKELIEYAPYQLNGAAVRCHELAYVVGHELNLPVQVGKYGRVEHSWLQTPAWHILDVYAVGRLPQVQLVDPSPLLPEHRCYVPFGSMWTNLRHTEMHELLLTMRRHVYHVCRTECRVVTIRVTVAEDVMRQWVAICPEFDIVSQGDSPYHAFRMGCEAVEVCLRDDAANSKDPFNRKPIPDGVTQTTNRFELVGGLSVCKHVLSATDVRDVLTFIPQQKLDLDVSLGSWP